MSHIMWLYNNYSVCPSGKVYLECGTDCPDTCENKDDEVRICNLRCVQGNCVLELAKPDVSGSLQILMWLRHSLTAYKPSAS